MQLDPQEKSQAWWRGTMRGALKGLVIGLAVGAATAILLAGAGMAFAPLVPVFSGFITMSGAFSTVPLAVFTGLSGMIAGMVNSGAAAVEALHVKKHFDLQMQQTEKLSELDGREQVLEQTMLPKSRLAEQIVAQGPRAQHSFAATEADRANAPSTMTLQ